MIINKKGLDKVATNKNKKMDPLTDEAGKPTVGHDSWTSEDHLRTLLKAHHLKNDPDLKNEFVREQYMSGKKKMRSLQDMKDAYDYKYGGKRAGDDTMEGKGEGSPAEEAAESEQDEALESKLPVQERKEKMREAAKKKLGKKFGKSTYEGDHEESSLKKGLKKAGKGKASEV